VAVNTEIIVEIVAVGLCGSDMQRHRDGYATDSLGHELVGLTADTSALAAIRPLQPCGTCLACRKRRTEHCANDRSIGRLDTHDGGFSGRVRVRPDQLYPLPAQLSAPLATLADPLACVLHALRECRIQDTDALVIGDGPMAALAAAQLRQARARQVTVAVKTPERIERMSDFGDRVIAVGDAEADRYDVVVESVGGVSSGPILKAAAAVAPLGQVVALGVYLPHATAQLPIRKLLEKESVLRGSKAYRFTDDQDDFADALALLVSQPGRYAPIVTRKQRWSAATPQDTRLERGADLKVVFVDERHIFDRHHHEGRTPDAR
jgi:threonine dehydrogenase-like Zn-dependent dehydrogenase